jgi:hypothetical protein
MIQNMKFARSVLALVALCSVPLGFALPPTGLAAEKAPATATEGLESASPEGSAKPTQPQSASSDEDVIAYINQLIRQGWKDNDVVASKPATDGEWCRRVFLDVLGRTPTADEVTRFLAVKDKQKKSKLLDQMLNSDEYIEDYARNWTTLWTNILIGRTGGTDQNTIISRAGMQQYLRRSFLQNKPFDKFAYELISAQGVSTPGEEDYNGAVNFVLDNLDENATPATAKVARIFLGLQVQCTQCHNHPFNDWKQEQFWSLNAFFRQTRSFRTSEGRQLVSTRLQDQDFPGEGSDPNEAEIYYELRNGLLKVAYPVFVDGTKIDPSGYVNTVNRRTKLAELVRESPYLGKAMVNRVWGHFLGYGFTKPVDDMGPHNPPSHPELLDRLGQDFALHGYDLKQLIKWITLSEAYGLSSKFNKKNAKDDPTLGERPMFSHFYMRQMSAEQLYDSLIAATQADKTRGSYEEQERTKNMWLQQFSVAFGTDENDEATTFNGTIPQTLMMMNGELIVKATNCEPGTFLHTVATSDKDLDAKVSQLYLAALARKPSKTELSDARKVVTELRRGDSIAAMQDIWWVLLNSNEFILNH